MVPRRVLPSPVTRTSMLDASGWFTLVIVARYQTRGCLNSDHGSSTCFSSADFAARTRWRESSHLTLIRRGRTGGSRTTGSDRGAGDVSPSWYEQGGSIMTVNSPG